MPQKTVREMGAFERLRYSLGAKMFRAVIIVTILLGVAAITFGFYLYSSAVQREYRTQAWHAAKTARGLVDPDITGKKIAEIIALYEASNEVEEPNEEYLAQFEALMDQDYESIRSVLQSIEKENEASSVYFAALDLEKKREVFLIDSDQSELFCPPGYWDNLSDAEIRSYLGVNEVSAVDEIVGYKAISSYIMRDEKYGYLCIGGDVLYADGRYAVLAFVDLSMEHIVDASRRFLIQYILLLLTIGIIVALLMTNYLKKHVVRPINELADAANAYSMDKKDQQRTGRHFENLDIHTGDEIENLSLTMKDMENDLAEYVQNLTQVTAEKERLNTELDVARQIQEGMIPHIFPAFPERTEFDIYASMNPAKEVGGDFYDFFLIDDDHLAVLMADVSGKGIPAALFMMASKILIGNIATISKSSPGEVLRIVNNQICSNNSAEMFVTVWLGILELSTGKLTAANAGHEYPVVRRGDGTFELYKEKHGFVVGGMADMVYTEYEIELKPGDAVFQYTDGVTEATNSDDELFGIEGLVNALNREKHAAPEQVLKNVMDGINEFVGDAPQFDDITMLCLEYRGK